MGSWFSTSSNEYKVFKDAPGGMHSTANMIGRIKPDNKDHALGDVIKSHDELMKNCREYYKIENKKFPETYDKIEKDAFKSEDQAFVRETLQTFQRYLTVSCIPEKASTITQSQSLGKFTLSIEWNNPLCPDLLYLTRNLAVQNNEHHNVRNIELAIDKKDKDSDDVLYRQIYPSIRVYDPAHVLNDDLYRQISRSRSTSSSTSRSTSTSSTSTQQHDHLTAEEQDTHITAIKGHAEYDNLYEDQYAYSTPSHYHSYQSIDYIAPLVPALLVAAVLITICVCFAVILVLLGLIALKKHKKDSHSNRRRHAYQEV